MSETPAPEAPADPARDARKRYWRTVAVFALAGPYIGLAISLFIMAVVGLTRGQPIGSLLSGLAGLAVISAVFAIPVAGLPGFLTGLVAAQMQRRGTAMRRYYALTGAVGALTALAIPIILRSPPEFWIFAGAGTALICAHLTRAR
ncbi:hypothetical protein [Caulobacter mirabilis]|uniref:Uncharacterized protein n=1 Tax=Caulobacter mirabilis TaxID=69666 RepID=A0A2D2AXE4_9CAUL|nr:hypothetical protein [Caulobacter mirabilis]ATQ42672.1 hypothetical protein CSW64_09740 [Caulobacter mirabilis]